MKTPSDIAAPHAFDPVAERAERQMSLLAQLTEIGLGLARRLVDEVDDGRLLKSDPALAYTRIARTVRQCIALEMKIDEALREWLGLSEAERAERRAPVGAKAVAKARAEADTEDADEIEDEGSFIDIVAKVCRDLGVTPDWSGWSEDGPEDLVVKPDGAGGFWRGGDLALAPGLWRAGRPPPQRGPPS